MYLPLSCGHYVTANRIVIKHSIEGESTEKARKRETRSVEAESKKVSHFTFTNFYLQVLGNWIMTTDRQRSHCISYVNIFGTGFAILLFYSVLQL